MLAKRHRAFNSMLGKAVRLNHHDWDDRLLSIMATDRASKHQSMDFSLNLLVLATKTELRLTKIRLIKN